MKTSLKIEREECEDHCRQNYPVLYSRILGKVLEMRSVSSSHNLWSQFWDHFVKLSHSQCLTCTKWFNWSHKVVQLVATAPLRQSQEDVAAEVSAEVSGGDCAEAEDGGSALVWTGGRRGGASGYQVNIPDTCLE